MSTERPTRQQYDALVREIQEHNRRYYVESAPTISDYEYDQLYKRLERIEAAHPDLIAEYSPTRHVGAEPVSAFPKVVRDVPMLSLDNTYDESELREFDERVRRGLDSYAPEYVVELKVDGIGIELTYEGGRLVSTTQGVRGIAFEYDSYGNVSTVRDSDTV